MALAGESGVHHRTRLAGTGATSTLEKGEGSSPGRPLEIAVTVTAQAIIFDNELKLMRSEPVGKLKL
jgi:hypothetical protein